MGSRLELEPRPAHLSDGSPPCGPTAGGPAAGVGDELRRMYDDIVTSPMPQSLLDLCDALEEAFRRGDLHAGCESKTRG